MYWMLKRVEGVEEDGKVEEEEEEVKERGAEGNL